MLAIVPLFIALLAGSVQVLGIPQQMGDELTSGAPAPAAQVGNISPQISNPPSNASEPAPHTFKHHTSTSRTSTSTSTSHTSKLPSHTPKPKVDDDHCHKSGPGGDQYTGDITYYTPGLSACGTTDVSLSNFYCCIVLSDFVTVS